MDNPTPIDRAFAAMMADEENAGARLAFYERLCDCELFMLLDGEPAGNVLNPRIFPLAEGDFTLIFDLPERLVEFADAMAPYGALSGRAIITMLAGKGVGLGLNLGVAPSSYLIPASAVDWLAQILRHRAQETKGIAREFASPSDFPPGLLSALRTKLALAAGHASCAYLVSASYADGASGHLLGFVDARPNAQPALTQAISEVLVFWGAQTSSLDVAFFGAGDPVCARLARVGLRFDLSEQRVAKRPSPPGMDPDKPPKLG